MADLRFLRIAATLYCTIYRGSSSLSPGPDHPCTALRHKTTLSDVFYMCSLSYLSVHATGGLTPVTAFIISFTMVLTLTPVHMCCHSCFLHCLRTVKLSNCSNLSCAQPVLYNNLYYSTLPLWQQIVADMDLDHIIPIDSAADRLHASGLLV